MISFHILQISPLLFRFRRRITLPAGAVVTHPPAELAIKSSYVRAARRSSVSGLVISDSFALNLPVGTVTQAAYERFARNVRKVDEGFEHTTRLTLPDDNKDKKKKRRR